MTILLTPNAPNLLRHPYCSRQAGERYLVIRAFFTQHGSSLARSDAARQPSRARYSTAHPLSPSDPRVPSPGHAQDYTPFIRRLIRRSSLAVSPTHRPTKEDLLAAAESWWQRFRIRLKWFTIRGWRRFNADDFSAFASWFVVGNTLWILVGTTTFVSAVFATLNSLSLQEYVARWISDYMTSETGVTVIFESAIVPRWSTGHISFRNVYVSRRPQSQSETSSSGAVTTDNKDDGGTKSEGEPARRRAEPATPPSPVPFLSSALEPDTHLHVAPAAEGDNYTMFDVNLDEVEVTLSFMRWLDGKGLIKDAKVKGVRGVIDRRSVWWDTTRHLDPSEFRHAIRPGDFELDSLLIEDLLVTVYQPGGQRPYNVSIFNAVIGPFRKRWLFYDLISAEGMTGQFDNCLFSLHMPQKLGKKEASDAAKRMARFRIDGLAIEHAQYAAGHQGPMSWITSGKLDAVLDIQFPAHPDDELDLKAIIESIGREVATITGQADAAAAATEADADAETRTEPILASRSTADADRPDTEAAPVPAPAEHGHGHKHKLKHGSAKRAASAANVESAPALVPDAARLADQLSALESSRRVLPGQHRLARPPLRAPSGAGAGAGAGSGSGSSSGSGLGAGDGVRHGDDDEARRVVIDIDLRFRDLKAAVPVFPPDLSVASSALIRPIVAFINANRTLVPIHCQVAAPLRDFDGSWTLFETGLMSSISDQVYAALAHHVGSAAANSRRIRQVGVWGIQRGAEVLIDTLKMVVDPVHIGAAA
ncbi:Mitochondrial distribution and morphology protein 31, mitochondrial precursor [Cryptotrichosporon argae]